MFATDALDANRYEIPSDTEIYQLPLHNRSLNVVPSTLCENILSVDRCLAQQAAKG